MKANRNKQVQIVILCALAAVVLGLGAVRIVGGGMQTQPDPTATKVPDEQPARSEVTAPVPDALVSDKPASNKLASRDPFAPQMDLAPEAPRPPNAGGATAAVNVSARVPPFPFISPFSDGPANVLPVAQQEDPASALRLTGVIEGKMNVAIIRGPDNKRYIVREGQTIDGLYVVQKISRSGVTIKYNGKALFLTLGSRESSGAAPAG
jgi:hypothetical protein